MTAENETPWLTHRQIGVAELIEAVQRCSTATCECTKRDGQATYAKREDVAYRKLFKLLTGRYPTQEELTAMVGD